MVNLITDAAVSLLDNFPISGSSTLHNPVQSLVGLQGMALRDQFYPNGGCRDAPEVAHGVPEAHGFQPMAPPSVLVLRALLTTRVLANCSN